MKLEAYEFNNLLAKDRTQLSESQRYRPTFRRNARHSLSLG